MANDKKSIITKWMDYCMICGHPTEEVHHALYGSKHKLADEDHLLMPLCREHHNFTKKSVHMNPEMKILSQQLAQLAWERKYLADKLAADDNLGHQSADDWMDEAREAFRRRYGESYL